MAVSGERPGTVRLLYFSAVLLAAEGIKLHHESLRSRVRCPGRHLKSQQRDTRAIKGGVTERSPIAVRERVGQASDHQRIESQDPALSDRDS